VLKVPLNANQPTIVNIFISSLTLHSFNIDGLCFEIHTLYLYFLTVCFWLYTLYKHIRHTDIYDFGKTNVTDFVNKDCISSLLWEVI